MFDYSFPLRSSIIRLISEVSRLQGELQGLRLPVANLLDIQSLAQVDSVHFSTKIEGNALTHKQVTEILLKKKGQTRGGRDLKEVVNYARTRQQLLSDAGSPKSFNHDLILKTHATLMRGIVRGRLKGHYRESQNVIRDSRTRQIVYLPPEAGDVRALMTDLIRWCEKQKTDGDPLVAAAVFHYRFVTIHPFLDGNGRTARLLTNVLLSRAGFEVHRYAALEKQHEKNRSAYYSMLRASQAETYYEIPESLDLSDWIEYFLLCLRDCYLEALERVRGSGSGSLSSDFEYEPRLKHALKIFKKNNRLSAAEYVALMAVGRTQAVADLNELIERGFIERVGGGRSSFYRRR